MKLREMTQLPRRSGVVISAMLAVALVACDRQSPPPPPIAKVVPPAAPVQPEPEPQVIPPQKSPEPNPAVSDKQLAARVKSALLAERNLNAHGIDVVAKDGVVTLYGTAETSMRRDMAGRVAATVTGVKAVENKLAIVAGS